MASDSSSTRRTASIASKYYPFSSFIEGGCTANDGTFWQDLFDQSPQSRHHLDGTRGWRRSKVRAYMYNVYAGGELTGSTVADIRSHKATVLSDAYGRKAFTTAEICGHCVYRHQLACSTNVIQTNALCHGTLGWSTQPSVLFQ